MSLLTPLKMSHDFKNANFRLIGKDVMVVEKGLGVRIFLKIF